MKPAWDRLMGEYSTSANSLVGDVDCTVEEELCSTNGVEGYPSIKWGTPGALVDYEGGREYDDLAAFAKANLGPSCGITTPQHCSGEEKKDMEEAQKLSNDQIKEALDKRNAEIKVEQDAFEAAIAKLEVEYERLSVEKEAKVKAMKNSGTPSLAMLNMVSVDRGIAVPEADEADDTSVGEEEEPESEGADEEENEETEEPSDEL